MEAAAHEAGSRALETGEDEEREALRKAVSEAIQQGELARCVLLMLRCVLPRQRPHVLSCIMAMAL